MPYTTLISVEDLKKNLDQCTLLDCRFNLADVKEGQQAYIQEHLPSSQYAHLDYDLSSPVTLQSGRHPLPQFDKFIDRIKNWGINPDSQVVVYDDTGGTFAARLWWLLKVIGHENVAVLNGGFSAWKKSGYPVTSEIVQMQPTSYTALPDSKSWCDLEELQQCLKKQSCLLIDARTVERYNGESEPIDPVAGHIPGALNQPLPLNIDENGYFQSPEKLKENYASYLENRNPEEVINMCGSGVFACHAILAIEIAGYGRTRLYPGSWSEWIRDPSRSIAVA